MRLIRWIKKNRIKSAIAVALLVWYYFCLPKELFKEPYATVIESKEGELLSARIATDGQWRFPAQDSVPYKFKQCITHFEDEYFYKHPGFNPVSIVKAIRDNYKAGKVVRGGSTLTQQVIRLSRNKNRTYWEKLVEMILATRLELRYSKDEILNLYAAHAPYGGNVVGLEMASWRYFGVQPHQLSWAETATLAVLPNAPGLIYPGRNQDELVTKRNGLLKKLFEEGVIDATTYQLSIQEEPPQKPFDLPQIAPHLLQNITTKRGEGYRVKTTVDAALQHQVNQIAKRYYNEYRQTEIHNLAILIVDVQTRNIVVYTSNAPTDRMHQKDVDIITAPRSTGSVLKPLLFASMLDAGELLPNTLIADIPTQIAGYSPKNYDMTYDGAVPAQKALSRSLNIPAVLMLKEYGIERFYDQLQDFKLSDVNKGANHYGLSLVLGGAESNLWDLCQTYAGLTSTLNYFTSNDAKYRTNEFAELNWDSTQKRNFGEETYNKPELGAGAIWLTYNAMKEVNRPEEDGAWRFYDSSLEIAWKTGTSFGGRDAWAIGTSPRYVVGVWVGNASGEGRPSLTGVGSAAPVLFDVFHLLPRHPWFKPPLNDLEEVAVCSKSGHLAGENCTAVMQWIPPTGKKTIVCPYHKLVHLDASLQYRVNSNCEPVAVIVNKPWFVLPPVMEWYYKKLHTDYMPLPPVREDCNEGSDMVMDFIYPRNNSKIYLTKDFSGELQPVIFKAAHIQTDAKLFWYINDEYLGVTQTFHEMPVEVKTGQYYITITDESGNEITRSVEIISK